MCAIRSAEQMTGEETAVLPGANRTEPTCPGIFRQDGHPLCKASHINTQTANLD